jgi:cell division transport system ATP-binding protein
MIEFQAVSKSYPGDITALRQVDLKVAEGEFVFLSGPSGAGKSTLLKLLYRAEAASAGRVLLEGVDLGRLAAHKVPALRRRLGVIFQDFKLLYDRSVWDNVAFALEVQGLPSSEVRRETQSALEGVGLMAKAKLNPHRLSGGEQQRVAVARALAHDPAVVLADEPTGNLDADTSWEVFSLLKRANEKGATVLVASHNAMMMQALSCRVVRLRDGRVEDDGAAQPTLFSPQGGGHAQP